MSKCFTQSASLHQGSGRTLRRSLYARKRGCKGAAVSFQGVTHEAIIVKLSLASHGQETSIGQHLEVLRTGCLRHRKTRRELTAAALSSGSNRLQDPEARGVCKGFGNSHHLLLVHGLLHRYIVV